ncbi:DUF1697 domain-containing protein [Phycicoccus sp. CSK15P-2]|uniref:DUF1697 domain-containing protein n=1 Tax=Phycicoccus sp. CSK15P-2 TaxID=2807627 RepID=UPI001950F1FE|nr:DUF1697 domain-containing protein [Phycicoccus sp. CSK15P-2]MBM6405766.1 DUF1697 domain-containing protein [Phycicoccus sp. CSK15P-2]
MPGYIAFLRAVNVGGRRSVRMAGLRAALEDAGYTQVETHIQSGNVAVTSRRRTAESVAGHLTSTLSAWAGFDIPCIVRTPAALGELVREADAVAPMFPGPVKRYLAVADGPVPQQAAATFAAWTTSGERAVALTDAVLAELGRDFHESTLTNARIEKITGLTTTWRALEVVRTVAEKWSER